MPMYTFQDLKTEIKIEVIRSMADSDVVPTRSEAGALTDEEFEAAEWQRIIEHAPKFAGFKGKGNWGKV